MDPHFFRTVGDVLRFYNTDCSAFDRLLRQGCCRELAQQVTALWMWLDRVLGLENLLASIVTDPNDESVIRYLGEAQLILEAISPDLPQHLYNLLLTPLPLTCAAAPPQDRDLRFFYINRDIVATGIEELVGIVGWILFDDELRALMLTDPNNPALAREFVPRDVKITNEHGRMMFVKFNAGFALTSEEIHNYFADGCTPDHVERVVVEVPTPGALMLYGKVIFSTAEHMESALKGNQLARFLIGDDKFFLGFSADDLALRARG